MKYVSVILLLGLLPCCESTVSNQHLETFVSENISFNVQQESYVLGDTVIADLQNNSSTSIWIGNPFSAEKKQGKEWSRVGPSSPFTLEGIRLDADSLRLYRFTLATDSSGLFPDYSFSEGTYRVRTSVSEGNDQHTLTTSPFKVSVAN